jgi:hypothetical protein
MHFRRQRIAITGLAVVLTGAAFGTAADAGVARFVSQERLVTADTGAGFDFPTANVKRQSASDFGPFHGDAVSRFVDQFEGEGAFAEAKQDSVLTDTRLSVASTATTGAQEAGALATSTFRVSFELDESRPFVLTYGRQFNSGIPENEENTVGDGRVLLHRLDSTDAPLVDFSFHFSRPDRSPTTTFRELAADLSDTGAIDQDGSAAISAELVTSRPGTPSPVPLPPAAWAALPALAWMARRALRSRGG